MTRASESARPVLGPTLPTRGVSSFEYLTDRETLERLLARSLRGGGRRAAEAIMARFGSLAAALAASEPSLCAILPRKAAADLRLVHEAARRIVMADLPRRAVISSWSALAAYLKLTMAHLDREAFRVLFLDKKNQLILDEVMSVGAVDHAPVYPREVMRRALELAASALILVHNHPSGDPTPSSADLDMTRQVIDAGRALRIAVHDHVVVGRDGLASFKALGLI